MEQNLKVDAITFILRTIEGIENDINYSYPNQFFDKERGHTSLQMVHSRVKTLRNFLKAIDQPKTEKEDQS